MNKKYIAGIFMSAITAVIMAGCTTNAQNDNAKVKTLELPVYTLTIQDTILTKPYVADIHSLQNIEIRNRVKGFLERIYVDEGKSVKKGQLLFKISDQELKVKLAEAQAALSNAEADAKATALEVERVKLLVDKKVISKSELDVAQARLNAENASVEQARSQAQSAKNHIGYTYIRAPYDGIVDRIPLKAGSFVDEGALLTSLSDNHEMFAYFSFPENEYLQWVRNLKTAPGKTSDNVKLVLSDGLDFPHEGKIETVEGEIEKTTGSINFRARFPNPERLLKHGATGKLYISSKADSVILVPQQAVFDIQDQSYVYIVDKDNKLKMHAFTPLTRFSDFYIMKEGLKPGDRILYEGTQNVTNGMVIKPKQLNSDKLLAKK